MRQGVLVTDQFNGRMKIRFSVNEYSEKLHCGQILEVLVDDTWKQTRFGYDGRWILEGIDCSALEGLRVRI